MDTELSDARNQLQRFEKFLKLDPENVRLLEDSADLLLTLGQPVQARQHLESALALKLGDEGLRFKLGTACLAAGEAERAYELYRHLALDGIKHPALSYNLAYAAFSAGRPDEAIERLDEIEESDRRQLPRFAYLRARALYYGRKNAEALVEISQFVTDYPGDLDGILLQAQCLEDAGDLQAAAALAETVLAARPDDVLANLVAGEIAMFMQRADTAAPHLQKVVALSPSNGRAWSAMGFIAVERRQIDSAIEYFKKAVVLMPDHLGTWHGLAWCQILRSDLVGAQQSADAAMQVSRTFADNHGTLAVIFYLQGHLDQASQSMKRGLRLNPKSAASLFAQSLLMSAKGDQVGRQGTIRTILEGRKLPDGTTVDQAIARQMSAIARSANEHGSTER